MDTIAQRPADLPHDHAVSTHAAYHAYRILQLAFIIAPIVAGIDKFFNKLTSWDMYLAPQLANALGANVHMFMRGAGIIEIIAGIGIALKPRYFSWIVALWLLGIIINLLLTHSFFDITLRDVGLFLAALAFAQLARNYDVGPVGGLMKTAR